MPDAAALTRVNLRRSRSSGKAMFYFDCNRTAEVQHRLQSQVDGGMFQVSLKVVMRGLQGPGSRLVGSAGCVQCIDKV
jgi:hypothetical protein